MKRQFTGIPTGPRLAKWCRDANLNAAAIVDILDCSERTAFRILSGEKSLTKAEWRLLSGG